MDRYLLASEIMRDHYVYKENDWLCLIPPYKQVRQIQLLLFIFFLIFQTFSGFFIRFPTAKAI